MHGMSVAVVGAGLAGLTCAQRLHAAGARVTIFDKARGPGGRLSTRRHAQPDAQFDHGAQFFRAHNPAFAAAVDAWHAAGVVAEWHGRVEGLGGDGTLWVGTPRMSALTRHLAQELDARWQTRIARIERAPGGWHLTADDGAELGHWQQVIVATPAPQAVPLLADAPALASFAASARLDPCWALMLGFDAPLAVDFDARALSDGPLSWIARNTSKPDRGPAECWVVHASPAWSTAHLELERDAIIPLLRAAFAAHAPHPEPVVQMAHRWRYARVATPGGAPCRYDRARGIGVCGDWCIGPRVEAAWLSGAAMATMLTLSLGDLRSRT